MRLDVHRIAPVWVMAACIYHLLITINYEKNFYDRTAVRVSHYSI